MAQLLLGYLGTDTARLERPHKGETLPYEGPNFSCPSLDTVGICQEDWAVGGTWQLGGGHGNWMGIGGVALVEVELGLRVGVLKIGSCSYNMGVVGGGAYG